MMASSIGIACIKPLMQGKVAKNGVVAASSSLSENSANPHKRFCVTLSFVTVCDSLAAGSATVL